MKLTQRRKAAIIVQLLLQQGEGVQLSRLPESTQELLASEVSALRTLDKNTVMQVVEEFVTAVDQIGLTPFADRDATLSTLSPHLSPALAARLRDAGAGQAPDPWTQVANLDETQLLQLLGAEAVEVAAITLSKLPTAKAAGLLGQLSGPLARSITLAMSRTTKVTPKVVLTIGKTLAENYGKSPPTAFEKPPEKRLGTILNASTPETRMTLLDSLEAAEPAFASKLRKAIFTFRDIPHRIKSTDVPALTREIDASTLTTAIAAALSAGDELSAAAEFLLENMPKRLAAQMRDDANDLGEVANAAAQSAMTELTSLIQQLADDGALSLLEADDQQAA